MAGKLGVQEATGQGWRTEHSLANSHDNSGNSLKSGLRIGNYETFLLTL
jgi:hypothetical protein